MKNKIILAIFCAALLCGSAVIALPGDPDSVLSENRTPATLMPITAETLSSGEIASNFEEFLGDNMWLRSALISTAGRIARAKGIDSSLGKIVPTNKDIGTSVSQKSSLLVSRNTVMEVFIKNPSAEKKYVQMLNTLADEFKDKKIYSMLVPTQLTFCEPVYANIQDSQKETIDYIYTHSDERINKVDAYDMLKENKDKYLYFRTDHHWTVMGAYYGYCAFLKSASGDGNYEIKTEKKDDPFRLEEFENIVPDGLEKHTVNDFYGSLYAQADTPSLSPDTVEWYDTDPNGKVTIKHYGFEDGKPISYDGKLFDTDKKNYSVFLSGDHQLSVIDNANVRNGKTILIIKDSYTNAFVSWLTNNYERIILLDPRAYRGGIKDVVEKYNPQEIMVMNYIFTSTFEDYSETIMDLIKK